MKTQYYCLLENDKNLAKTPVKLQMTNDETTKILENNILELANVAAWANTHTFHQAMKLAFFLIPIKKIAAQITQEAINLAKIKSSEKKAHRKRWFTENKYQDGGGPSGLLMHENQFIQTMIYQEAEKYEKYQEGIITKDYIDLIQSQANSNADELLELLSKLPMKQTDWIIRYLKTIVQNSNNVSADLITAIACLVCNFQPKDAATLHAFFEAISPNYCSKRKLLLMNRLINRFPLLKVCKQDGKQTYFYGQEQVNSKWSSLVETFFAKTVPWGTRCGDATQHTTLPMKDKIKKLISVFTKNYILEKDHKQMSYLHAIVCPDCFLKLIFEVRFDCPREKLTLPIFLAENDANSDNGELDPNNNPEPNLGRELELTQIELEDLADSSSKYLSKEIERRNNISIKKISILLDGQPQPILIDKKEQTVWDLTQNKLVWLTLKENSSLPKIVSWDKEGLLIIGLLELNSKAIRDSWQHKLLGWKNDHIILPNNNKINLAIKLIENENGEEFFIGATYEDLTKNNLFNNISFSNWQTSRQQLATVCLLFLVLFGSVFIWRKTINPVELTNNVNPISLPSIKPTLRGKVITTLLPVKTDLDDPKELNKNKIAFNFYPKKDNKNDLNKIDELLKLEIPNNINTMEIFFAIKNFSNYEQYLVVIETTEPKPISVWKQAITRQKNKFPLSVSVSLDVLHNQEYNLIIKRIDNNGMEKELERYNFIMAHSN
ncbi:MAG: hypothetical protein HY819_16705 [Acidobacteria bacterium]|nr:hypothetical protein [Acidobacteriota bacterium]